MSHDLRDRIHRSAARPSSPPDISRAWGAAGAGAGSGDLESARWSLDWPQGLGGAQELAL